MLDARLDRGFFSERATILPRTIWRRPRAFPPARWRSICERHTGASAAPGVGDFFPRPSAGSACKRLNLFLRWMVRTDAVDLGVWTRVSPCAAHRPARHARDSRRTVPAADALREPGLEDGGRDHAPRCARLDPADPVKYDFSLCHLGMAKSCGFNGAQGYAVSVRASCRLRVSDV